MLNRLNPSVPSVPKLFSLPTPSQQAWYVQHDGMVQAAKDLVRKGVTEDRLLSESEALEQHSSFFLCLLNQVSLDLLTP